jgi:DNA-binding CsgD family transcriptional regulator
VPAYVVDATGSIRWLNAAAREIVGDAVGSDITDVVDVEPGAARTRLQRRLAREDERDHSVVVMDSEGRKTRLEISSVPVGNGHRAIGMFGLAVRRDAVPRRAQRSPLTPRQHEVLELLAEGTSTSGIAVRLTLSEQTVRNHVRDILQRLGANSRLGAIATARRDGLV